MYNTIITLDMKGCICHFAKWRIHPLISKGYYISNNPLFFYWLVCTFYCYYIKILTYLLWRLLLDVKQRTLYSILWYGSHFIINYIFDWVTLQIHVFLIWLIIDLCTVLLSMFFCEIMSRLTKPKIICVCHISFISRVCILNPFDPDLRHIIGRDGHRNV